MSVVTTHITCCNIKDATFCVLYLHYIHTTAMRMVLAYTKCDVQLIKLPLMMD